MSFIPPVWFMEALNQRLARGVMYKFKHYRHRFYAVQEWLACIAEKEELIFYYWRYGALPRFANKEKGKPPLIMVK